MVERAERRDDGGRFSIRRGQQFAQRRSGILTSAFDEETLRSLPSPEKRAGTFTGEILHVEHAHIRRGRTRRILVGEPIDAASVVPRIHAVLLLQMAWNGGVVLDDFAVVIGDPDGAVRAMREVHRMTPLVAGCGKLRLLLARRTAEFQRRAIRLDERAMDEIARRFANKILPVQTGQCVVLINHRPAGGGEPAARLAFRRAVAGVVVFEIRRVIRAFLPPRMRLRNRVGPPVAGVGFERGRGRIGITREIAPRNRRDADAGRSRRHRETPASFRHRETEGLRVARHWFNRAAVCANAKVGARQLDGRDQMRPRDFSTAPAAPEINPAIRAPLRRIDATLQLAGRKAAEQFLPHLGPAIAIAVREENDVRRAGDDDSTARGHESIDRRQIGSPHLRRIHAPIAVGVAQHFHHPESARIRRLLKLLPRLHSAHLRVQHPRLV